jgi:hypothetical protein
MRKEVQNHCQHHTRFGTTLTDMRASRGHRSTLPINRNYFERAAGHAVRLTRVASHRRGCHSPARARRGPVGVRHDVDGEESPTASVRTIESGRFKLIPPPTGLRTIGQPVRGLYTFQSPIPGVAYDTRIYSPVVCGADRALAIRPAVHVVHRLH